MRRTKLTTAQIKRTLAALPRSTDGFPIVPMMPLWRSAFGMSGKAQIEKMQVQHVYRNGFSVYGPPFYSDKLDSIFAQKSLAIALRNRMNRKVKP